MILDPAERQSYCAGAAVRRRIADFFGGALPSHGTAIYVAPGTEWESLVVHLDIEYVNFDYPAHPFVAQEQIFEFQRPVISALVTILTNCDLNPLHLLTGRGHHFVWKISKQSWAFEQLAGLGRMFASLRRFYAATLGPVGETVPVEMGAAFAGLGLVIEHVAHQIKALAVETCQVPVELGAIEAGGA